MSGNNVTVTVSDAAKRLGVTLPRLMRLLKRPEWEAKTTQESRQTRTGTRTVTVVSVSVLSEIKAAFDDGRQFRTAPEGNAQNIEQKRKHSRGEPLPFLADETTRAYLAAMMAQADARINEQAATIADLRRDKDDLRGRLEASETERKRLHERGEALALAAAIDTAQEATRAQKSGEKDAGGQSAGNKKPRSFLASLMFWKINNG